MRYRAGDWIPESVEEKLLLIQPHIEKKKIISPITKKFIKVPVADNPTPLAIDYIILKSGKFIEVPRTMYHPLFFRNFIKLYTGIDTKFQNYMEQIDYFNQELQQGIYILDYGRGDGSHSLFQGRLYLPTEEFGERFIEGIKQFERNSRNENFHIIYVCDREEYDSLDMVDGLKRK